MNHTPFDTLLQSRPQPKATPFWRLHVNEEELKDLIAHVRSELQASDFAALSQRELSHRYRHFNREACLLYALWWTRRYDGGKQSWEEPLRDFGIDVRYLEHVRAAILLELKQERRLGIKIYVSEGGNHMYLQSLLAQGGLPMKLMGGENGSTFENYLYHLVSEYELLDERDWDNISRAKQLAKDYLNNSTLRESDAVVEFALEIVRAYLNDDQSAFSDYELVQRMMTTLHERRGKRKERARNGFNIVWELQREADSFKWRYYVSVPREMACPAPTADGIHIDVADHLSYYVANRLVAAYSKQGERYLLQPLAAHQERCTWRQEEGSLRLVRKEKTQLIPDPSLLNALPPSLEEPLLLRWQEGAWQPHQGGEDGHYACLMSEEWEAVGVEVSATLRFEGLAYRWVELDGQRLKGEGMTLRHRSSGEELRFDHSVSPYSVAFMPPCPDWVEVSSKPVAVDMIDLKRYFRYFNEENECGNSGFKFFVKSSASSSYEEWRSGRLPAGPLLLKVQYPDGRRSKAFAIYHLRRLSASSSEDGLLSITFSDGEYALLAGQSVCKVAAGGYRVEEQHHLNGFAPIKFSFVPNGVRQPIDVGFSSPLQRSCFYDQDGRILQQGFAIALSELHQYKMNLAQRTAIVLSYYERKEHHPTCVARKKIKYPQGRYSLDYLQDELERFVLINGANDHRKHITIALQGTGTELKIRRNAFLAHIWKDETGVKGIRVTRNNEAVAGLKLLAVAVNAPDDSPLSQAKPIPLCESDVLAGHYSLPPLSDKRVKAFVVFSDNRSGRGSMLPVYLNLDEEMNREQRDANKRESIERITHLLLEGDEQEWQRTWWYMKLVIQYRLSYFNSFNTFFAIANTPALMAEFLAKINTSGLDDSYDSSTLLYELERMERELWFRFHYVPVVHWKEQAERLTQQYAQLIEAAPVLKGSYPNPEGYIDAQLSLLRQLLERQFGENDARSIYYALLGHPWPQLPTYDKSHRDYCAGTGDALDDFDRLHTPIDLRFVRVEFHEVRPWNAYRPDEVWQKLQYLAIVLPQCAAQYAHGAAPELWSYQRESTAHEFIRRMINYMSVYAPTTYNELFRTALLRQPIK